MARRRRALMVVAAAAVVAVVAAVASAQSGVEPLAPSDGAVLHRDGAVTFRVAAPAGVRLAVEVSLSPGTGSDGRFLPGDAFVGSAELESVSNTEYDAVMDGTRFHRTGTYYWQPYRLDCDDAQARACAGPGPVRTFTIRRPALTRSSRLDQNGFGPVRVGMAEAEAEAAGRIELEPNEGGSNDPFLCSFLLPRGLSKVVFMVSRGRIVRASVGARGIATTRGIRVGDTERQVIRRYGRSRIRVTPHPYVRRGHYLTYRSTTRGRRIIFEASRGRVTSFRGGRTPEVGFFEGCV